MRRLTPEQAALLRSARNLALQGLEPADRVVLLARGRSHLPPLPLRYVVSSEESALEFSIYLKILADLTPAGFLLDIGCGPGMMALELRHWHIGDYLGMDPSSASVEWCRKHISPNHTNFQFVHADVYNGSYNPHGSTRAEDYVFPLAADTADAVLLKSVLTHMTPGGVVQYLREIKRVLKPSGRCIATFFLLADASAELGDKAFPYPDEKGIYRVRDKAVPENAIAFSEEWVMKQVSDLDLQVLSRWPGCWRMPQGGLSYQDLLVIGHR